MVTVSEGQWQKVRATGEAFGRQREGVDHAEQRRELEAPKYMAASLRTNQVNQVIRDQRTTFVAVIVNVNKRSVSADARAFTPNYLLGVDLFNSKRTVEG